MTIEEYFRKLNLKEIHRFVKEGEQETLELEFKQANPENEKGKQADLKNFAEALSGFANSQGGIILWGIEARKAKENGVDCASKLRPFVNPKAFVSLLTRMESSVVSPPVKGVRHKAIFEKNHLGYVASFIPFSVSLPHMVHREEQNSYYRRYGDSFKKAQHFEVVEMFNRKIVPEIDLEFIHSEQKIASTDSRFFLYPFLVRIVNQTNATIKYPFIKVYGDSNLRASYLGLDDNRFTPLKRIHSQNLGTFIYTGGSDIVIYPMQKLDLDYLGVISLSHLSPPNLLVTFEIGAEGMPIKTINYLFNWVDKSVMEQ